MGSGTRGSRDGPLEPPEARPQPQAGEERNAPAHGDAARRQALKEASNRATLAVQHAIDGDQDNHQDACEGGERRPPTPLGFFVLQLEMSSESASALVMIQSRKSLMRASPA